MRALIKSGRGARLRVEDVPAPYPGPGDVLVQVQAVGICGTDIHILHDVYPHADPLIPGHELVGTVIAAGADVDGWSAGERVVSELHTGADLTCETCRSGNPQICPSKRALGTWTDGAFAEQVVLPAWLLHRVPESLSDLAATLIEPGACALHGMLERGRIEAGDEVFVAGHGPIGLLSAQVAIASGASRVIVSGRSRKGTTRLEAAASLNVEVVDADHGNVAQRVLELTGGRGVDVAIETAGASGALHDCLAACRPGGRVTVLGLSGRAVVEFPWDLALLRDLDVVFSFSSKSSSWERTLELTERRQIGGEWMINEAFDLEDWEPAFAAMQNGRAIKVVLTP